MKTRRATGASRRRRAGLGQIEAMIAVALVAIAIVPALDALGVALESASLHGENVVEHYALLGLFEEVLSADFDALELIEIAQVDDSLPSVLSDPPGTPGRRLIFISPWDLDDSDGDGDPLTGTDSDVLMIRAEAEASGRAFQTVTIR